MCVQSITSRHCEEAFFADAAIHGTDAANAKADMGRIIDTLTDSLLTERDSLLVCCGNVLKKIALFVEQLSTRSLDLFLSLVGISSTPTHHRPVLPPTFSTCAKNPMARVENNHFTLVRFG